MCSAMSNESDVDIGIDIALRNKPLSVEITEAELLRRLRNNKSLGTSNEWRQVMTLKGDSRRLNEFYRFWAIKESVLKATGLGAKGLRPSDIDITTESLHPFESSQVSGFGLKS